MIMKYFQKPLTAPDSIEWRDNGARESQGFDSKGRYVAKVSYLIFKDTESNLWNAAVVCPEIGTGFMRDIAIYKDMDSAKRACEEKYAP